MADQKPLEVPVVFTSVDDSPVLFANQFVVQSHNDEFFLIIAQLQPPMLIGTPEQQQAQAAQMSHVPIRVLARVGMTRQRLADLAGILNEQLRRYDEKQGSKNAIDNAD